MMEENYDEGIKDLASLLDYLDYLENEKDISTLTVIYDGNTYIENQYLKSLINISNPALLNNMTMLDLDDDMFLSPEDDHPNFLGHKLISGEIIGLMKTKGIIDEK